MTFTAQQIATFIKGDIIGNPEASFSGFSKIEDTKEKTISFIAAPQYLKFLQSAKADAIIISKNLLPDYECNSTLIVVEDAHQAFVELMRIYNNMNKKQLSGISKMATIYETASVGNGCYIGEYVVVMNGTIVGNNCSIHPQVYIGNNVTIGDNTTLMSGVKIYDNCVIGSNCLIHAGAVIGADGFGFTQENGTNVKVPQMGNVVIGNNVEIGANCTIDKATMGSTTIHDDVKLDNLIHIAHNVEIGEHTVIAALTGIAGSCKIGSNCMIGGAVAIADHIIIGNNVKIVGKSGVISNIKDNEVVMGYPAFNFSTFKRSYACFRNLPERLKQLEDAAKNNK